MKPRMQIGGAAGLLALAAAATISLTTGLAEAVPAASVPSPFTYPFSSAGTLEEANSPENSASAYFWLNSGGRLLSTNGVGSTIKGDLGVLDKWRRLYLASSPLDSDNGLHPQNLFRLVTRSRWLNFRQTLKFRLVKLNLSASPERDGWSGVLLFARYVDNNNLYYLGVRHDGTAVIKKKLAGRYYTLAQKRVFNADAAYDRDTNPNLLPGKRWMGIRSVVRTNPGGSVTLQLWLDKQNRNAWEQAIEVVDTLEGPDGKPVTQQGYGGVRTDFADVEFDDYVAERL